MTQAEFFDDERFAPEPEFRGNSADVAAIGALVGGLLTLFLCLSCGTGLCCLPAFPVGLGVAGLLMAKKAENERRARMWSGIGLGMGLAVVALLMLAIAGISILIIFEQIGSGG